MTTTGSQGAEPNTETFESVTAIIENGIESMFTDSIIQGRAPKHIFVKDLSFQRCQPSLSVYGRWDMWLYPHMEADIYFIQLQNLMPFLKMFIYSWYIGEEFLKFPIDSVTGWKGKPASTYSLQ